MDMVKNLSLNYSFQYPQRNEKLKDLNIFNIMSLLVLTLLVVLVIGGNVLVITAFVSVGRKIQNLTNYFVVSLAVSDILVGAFSIPFWIWMQISKFRSSYRRCSVKRGALKNFANFTVKRLRQSHLCQRLRHRCFPVKYAKFLGTPFLQNTSGQLLL